MENVCQFGLTIVCDQFHLDFDHKTAKFDADHLNSNYIQSTGLSFPQSTSSLVSLCGHHLTLGSLLRITNYLPFDILFYFPNKLSTQPYFGQLKSNSNTTVYDVLLLLLLL